MSYRVTSWKPTPAHRGRTLRGELTYLSPAGIPGTAFVHVLLRDRQTVVASTPTRARRHILPATPQLLEAWRRHLTKRRFVARIIDADTRTVIVRCPYCAGKHAHGNTADWPSWRVADCLHPYPNAVQYEVRP